MLERELLAHGYIIVFLGTIVEADATMLAAAFLAHQGYLRMPLVLLVAILASTTVSHAVFFLARRRGQAAFDKKAATDKRWRRLQNAISRRGPWLLLISRFLFGLRTAINGACAASGMRTAVFSAMDLTGAAVWALIVGVGGFYIGHAISVTVGGIRRHERLVAASIFGALAVLLWHWQRRELAETVDAISHPAEHSLHSVEEVGEKLEDRMPDTEDGVRDTEDRSQKPEQR
jgi:membrane protein DedA with SNARE-associated domain